MAVEKIQTCTDFSWFDNFLWPTSSPQIINSRFSTIFNSSKVFGNLYNTWVLSLLGSFTLVYESLKTEGIPHPFLTWGMSHPLTIGRNNDRRKWLSFRGNDTSQSTMKFFKWWLFLAAKLDRKSRNEKDD